MRPVGLSGVRPRDVYALLIRLNISFSVQGVATPCGPGRVHHDIRARDATDLTRASQSLPGGVIDDALYMHYSSGSRSVIFAVSVRATDVHVLLARPNVYSYMVRARLCLALLVRRHGSRAQLALCTRQYHAPLVHHGSD